MPFALPDSWKESWDRHRVRVTQMACVILFFAAKPRSNVLFLIGFGLALMGEGIRFWAAGHIRKGQELAQHGPYAMTRHPLYLGSFIIACGFAFMGMSLRHHWISSITIWAIVLVAFYWLYPYKMDREETDLKSIFGAEFEAYRRRVPRFWPDLGRWREALQPDHWSFKQLMKNHEHRTFGSVLGMALLLRLKMVYRLQ